jgi:agmatinase
MRLPVLDDPSLVDVALVGMLELLAGLAARGTIVGVAPDDDPAGVTSIPAAQLLLNLIGRIFARR